MNPEWRNRAPRGDVHEIGGDRRGCRGSARAAPLQHHPPDKIALCHNRVVDALDRGSRGPTRNHAGMNTLLQSFLRQPCDAKQLDPIAELFGEIDVEPRYVADTLRVDALKVDRAAKADACEDRELVCGVNAVDVKARIGFRVAELLRFGQHFGELVRALAHRRQNVVAGSVQNTIDALQTIAGETLAQTLDYWDPAGDRGFERKECALFLRPYGELRPLVGHQRLVGCDHVLAVNDRGFDDLAGDPVSAADQLDDDIDLGIGGHRHRVLVPAHRRQISATITAAVTRRYRDDDEPAAGTLGQQLGLAIEQLQDAGADCAETSDSELQRRFHNDDPTAVCKTQEPPPPAPPPSLCSAAA